MNKRLLGVILALVAVTLTIFSWAATSWQLQTKLNNAGGTITVRSNTPQSTVGQVVYSNFTTSAPVPVVVAANPGYRITSLTRTGSSIAIGNYTTHYSTSFQKSGGSTQSLLAGFTVQPLAVTATVLGPGAISPANVSVAYGGSAVFSSNPLSGGSLLTGVTGGSVTDLSGNAITLPYAGPVRITAGNVTAPRTVTATYSRFTVNAGGNQYTLVNSLATLKGTLEGTGTPLWTQLSGPTVALSGATTLTPTFLPLSTGTYTFQLTEYVGSSALASATTQVSVVASLTDYMRLNCMGCHASNGVYPAGYVFPGWSTSKHKTVGVSCISCHTDGAMPTPVNSHVISSVTFAYLDGSGSYCLNGSCHQPAAVHKTAGMLCANCHGNYRDHNPGTSFAAAANACFGCHGGVNTAHYFSKLSMAADQCRFCHNQSGHNPLPFASVPRAHFNSYTSYANPAYAAAYVTDATLCADCHQAGDPSATGDTALLAYRADWAASRHGSTTSSAWKNSADHNWKASGSAGANAKLSAGIATDCQRCHSAAGYLQFALYTTYNPVAAASARYSEPLACNTCHPSGDFGAPRAIGPRTGYYNYSSPVTGRLTVSKVYPDAGRSNICLGCHVGREAGDTIKALAQATAHKSYSTAFWQDLGFVNSHYLTAGGQVFGTTGYEYPGPNYRNGSVDHSGVGSGTPQGPCVACHFPGSSHTLNPARAGYALCNGCHLGTGTVTAAFVSEKTDDFRAGLKALAAALTRKGFTPILDVSGVPVYPYFSTRDRGNTRTAPGNLGAAFNYTLLAQDPGAYAHNPTYTKRLLRDSVDYLVNGNVDRSRDLSATITALLTSPGDEAKAGAFLANASSGASACVVCHSDSVDPSTGHNIVADYQSSMHATRPDGAACVSCHAPSENVAHPHAPMLTAATEISLKCTGCHLPPVHPWRSFGLCSNCHNGHDPTPRMQAPHLANFSTAQYVTLNLSCASCHYTSDDPGNPAKLTFHIYTANQQWAQSGKANPSSPAYLSYDFKTMGSAGTPASSAGNDCVRCHTTTGYLNYVNSNFTDIRAWGTSGLAPGGDREREMIACPACHNPTPFKSYDGLETDMWGDPVQPAFSRRSVAAVQAYYNYSSQGSGRILNSLPLPDQGISNSCVACHSGTVAGTTLQAISARLGGKSAAFWNNTPFIDPHGMAAAGVMFSTAGYHYPTTRTRNYQPALSYIHDGIDDPYYGGQGSCVGCHLYTDKPHLFSPVSTAVNGAVTKIVAFEQVCIDCHDGGIQPIDLNNPANLDAKKQGFRSSLKALAAVLGTKGIYFNPGKSPYFFRVSDTAQQGPAGSYYTTWNALNATPAPAAYSGETLMGAAFNLRLLWSDGGAYAHNDVYAKKLIYDSIDLADNGALDSSVGSAIGALSTAGPGFNDADKTRALAYIGVRPR